MSQGTGLELILNAAERALQILITKDEHMLCAQEWRKTDRATEILTPALKEMCTALGIQPIEFRRIACICGPGSFTGIRLVLATAAALRRTGRAQLAGLNYLQALATTVVQRRSLPYGVCIWTLTHARRNLVHCQPYISYGPRIPAQPLAEVKLCSPQEAVNHIDSTQGTQPQGMCLPQCVWICGSGLSRNHDLFESFDGMGELPVSANAPVVALPEVSSPDFSALCLLARHGEYFYDDIQPLYVRPCDAVENLPHLAHRLGISGDEACVALQAQLARTPHSEI